MDAETEAGPEWNEAFSTVPYTFTQKPVHWQLEQYQRDNHICICEDKDCEPGSLRAAKNVCNVFQTPVRKRVNATPELSSHLRVKRWQLNNLHISIIVYTHRRQTHTHTCSLVVLPLATRTKWNPVSPATGTRNKPATHITAILSEVLRISMELNRFTLIFNVASMTYKEFWQANLKIKKLYQLQWIIKH